MGSQKQCSLWLCPDAEESCLSGVIRLFADRFASPAFFPHITLPSAGNELNGEHLEQLFSPTSGRTFAPFAVSFHSLEFGTDYYKCLYLTLQRSAALFDLFSVTATLCNSSVPFSDLHLSLAYGVVVSLKGRTAITECVAPLFLQPLHMSRVLLVETAGAVEAWRVMQEYRLPQQ